MALDKGQELANKESQYAKIVAGGKLNDPKLDKLVLDAKNATAKALGEDFAHKSLEQMASEVEPSSSGEAATPTKPVSSTPIKDRISSLKKTT